MGISFVIKIIIERDSSSLIWLFGVICGIHAHYSNLVWMFYMV